MWAVAAQPHTGLTPMIPTPSVDPRLTRSGPRYSCISNYTTPSSCTCKYVRPDRLLFGGEPMTCSSTSGSRSIQAVDVGAVPRVGWLTVLRRVGPVESCARHGWSRGSLPGRRRGSHRPGVRVSAAGLPEPRGTGGGHRPSVVTTSPPDTRTTVAVSGHADEPRRPTHRRTSSRSRAPGSAPTPFASAPRSCALGSSRRRCGSKAGIAACRTPRVAGQPSLHPTTNGVPAHG